MLLGDLMMMAGQWMAQELWQGKLLRKGLQKEEGEREVFSCGLQGMEASTGITATVTDILTPSGLYL